MYSKDEERLLRKDFWESFANYTKFYAMKIGHPISWMLYKTGIKGLELKFEVERKLVRVLMELNSKSEDRRFDMYVELDMYKNIINEGFENTLIWQDEINVTDKKNVAQIYTELNNITYHNRENWPQIFEFMATNMFKLQTNFEFIQDIFIEKFG